MQLGGDTGCAAWSFDVEAWGSCGQGPDEASALGDLSLELGRIHELVVVEHVRGDEQAFQADFIPATGQQREATLRILTESRASTLALLASCSDAVLDYDDPDRHLPSWASWRTLRQMFWHLADVESRYYLPSLGLPGREPEAELREELLASGDYLSQVIRTVPADLAHVEKGEVWTSTKLLRRVAWHERSELKTMRRLATEYATMP